MEPTILNLGRYLEITWRNIKTSLTIDEYVNLFFDKIDLFTSFFMKTLRKEIKIVCLQSSMFWKVGFSL